MQNPRVPRYWGALHPPACPPTEFLPRSRPDSIGCQGARGERMGPASAPSLPVGPQGSSLPTLVLSFCTREAGPATRAAVQQEAGCPSAYVFESAPSMPPASGGEGVLRPSILVRRVHRVSLSSGTEMLPEWHFHTTVLSKPENLSPPVFQSPAAPSFANYLFIPFAYPPLRLFITSSLICTRSFCIKPINPLSVMFVRVTVGRFFLPSL